MYAQFLLKLSFGKIRNFTYRNKKSLCYAFNKSCTAYQSDGHAHTHIRAHRCTRAHAWPCITQKRERYRRVVNQGSASFVVTAGLERVRVRKEAAAHVRL